MSTPENTRLARFQRIAGTLAIVAFLASIGVSLFEREEKSLLLAGGLILTTVFYTAYMIVSSIYQRRTLIALSKILSQQPDESKPESRDDGSSL
jgi:hypothetical protein